jgi:enamine deaminase RidA (YjgF/YER057c/UK114 family)
VTVLSFGRAITTIGVVSEWPFYVVDWTADKMPPLLEEISKRPRSWGSPPVPPSTLIGVAALDVPEHLIEIEATAVLDCPYVTERRSGAGYGTQFLVL